MSRNIEKSILQQIFYTEKKNKLKLSRFNRISKESKLAIFIMSLAIWTSIYFILQIIADEWLNQRIEVCKYYINNYKASFMIVSIVTAITIFFVTYKCIFFLFNKAYIKKGKVKEFEIEIGDKDESIFNKYLDEIIYYFQVTHHRAVVIEDLDRYETSAVPIFQKLREINLLINASKQVPYEVNFIYAIGDDFLKSPKHRIKFFDILIPVIPVVSNVYSNEVIWKRLENLKNKGYLEHKLEKNFINKIAIYIGDKRLIDNIINEFIIYKRRLDLENLDDKKLFSMITYKNLYPASFSELLKGDGKVTQIFNEKDSTKNEIIEQQKKEISNRKEKLKDAENSVFTDTNILKYALIGNSRKLIGDNTIRFYVGNTSIRADEIISKGKEFFEKNTIGIGSGYGAYGGINEEQIFSIFGSKGSFIRQWEAIENKLNEKKSIIIKEIEDIELEISRIESLNLMQLCEQYKCSNLFKNWEEEKVFIENGFIAEDFRDYITCFKEGDISISDHEFVLSVTNNKIQRYDYKLDKIKKIVEHFENVDYNKPAIINLDLMNYLVTHDEENKVKSIIESLDKQDFFINFVNDYRKIFESKEKFSKLLVSQSKTLWNRAYDSYKTDNDIEKLNHWILLYLQNEEAAANLGESFKNYIENYENFDAVINNNNSETEIKTLKSIGVRFKNIKKISNEEFLNQIYENNMYELNTTMVHTMIILCHGIVECTDNEMSVIHDSEKLKELHSYMLDNFEEYYSLTFNNGKLKNDNEATLKDILNVEEISIDIKKGIVDLEVFNNYCLPDYNMTDLTQYMIENDKASVNYNNVLHKFEEDGEIISYGLANHISNHVAEYSKLDPDNVDDTNIMNNFRNEYVLSDIVQLSDLKIIARSLKFQITKLRDCELEKIKFLVDSNLVEFNEWNYNYIVENTSEELLIFIKNNKDNFFENMNAYELPRETANRMILDDDINKDESVKIIEQLGGILHVNNDILLNLIIMDRLPEVYSSENDKIYTSVLEDESISSDGKLDFLDYILTNKFTQREEYLKYVRCLGEEYKDIKIGSQNAYLKNNDYNKRLCSILKSKIMISSYDLNSKKNCYIVWNYRK